MQRIRSYIYDITLPLVTIIVGGSLLIPSLFSRKAALFTGRLWGQSLIFFLKLICKIDYKITGLENLPKDQSFIIASKHQSAWETIAFLCIFKDPIIIHKKELLFLPIIGSYLKNMGMIAINRNNPKSSMETIINKSQESKISNRPIVIFPEGTRTEYGKKTKAKPGIYLIAKKTKYPVIPISLDSGKYWSKNLPYRKAGTINVKIAEQIKHKNDKEKFLKELENKI